MVELDSYSSVDWPDSAVSHDKTAALKSKSPKAKIGERQVSEYQEGDTPFGLGDGLALTVVYVTAKPQAILKLH